MKYKVGDKVKIRKDLKVDELYGDFDIVPEMVSYGGMVTTIMKCNDDSSYKIDADEQFYGGYSWTDEMFEGLVNSTLDEEKTIDVGYHLEYCGHRVLKDVIQGGTGVNRHYYTKNYDMQYIIPIDAIDFIIPHED